MKEKLLTAREVITLFKSELNYGMTEANFAKHKRAEVFKTHKKEGKKGDFYLWPDVAVDFFDNVRPGTQKGYAAIDKLEGIKAEYKRKREYSATIKSYFDKLHGAEVLTADMFVPDPLAGWDGESSQAALENDLIEINAYNNLLRDISQMLDDTLAAKYSGYIISDMRADILEAFAGWITTPATAAEISDYNLAGAN